MNWTQPRTLAQWLLLFSPAAVALGMSALATLSHRLIRSLGDFGLGMMLIGLLLAAVLSFVLGFWLGRHNSSHLVKAAATLVFGCTVLVVNAFIIFGGCTALANLRF